MRLIPSCSMYINPYLHYYNKKLKKVRPDYYKQTTGLTGLFVDDSPHRTLSTLYGRILRSLQQVPESAAYRKYTEPLVKQRLILVESEPDPQKLEERIGMGQLEEVIEQAEYELRTCRAIIDSKAWEPLVEQPPKGQWNWPIA
uniref:NADH dehydrogenase [ubiquinone] 1 alpha subcomplex subunit 5 n=1 Tax=Acrobeloides nanus TaxID=290746 RepID=A0A914CJP9_9BILA